MSATIEEITNLINEGYTVSISKPQAGIVSVKVKRDGKLVSSGCQRCLNDAMMDAYMGTPVIAGVSPRNNQEQAK